MLKPHVFVLSFSWSNCHRSANEGSRSAPRSQWRADFVSILESDRRQARYHSRMHRVLRYFGPRMLSCLALATCCRAPTRNTAISPAHQPSEPAPSSSIVAANAEPPANGELPGISNSPATPKIHSVTSSQLHTTFDITAAQFVGHMPTRGLPTSEDLDGDGASEHILQDSTTFSWHIGTHVYSGCSSCDQAVIVDFDKRDRRKEIILFGYPEDETFEAVVLQVAASGITATRWITSDGEVRWDASGALWIDKCGDTRTLYDLLDGKLLRIEQTLSPTHPHDCPG